MGWGRRCETKGLKVPGYSDVLTISLTVVKTTSSNVWYLSGVFHQGNTERIYLFSMSIIKSID